MVKNELLGVSLNLLPPSFEFPIIPEEEPKGRIKNVVFDWYGTLYDCMDQFPKVFAEEVHKRFEISEDLAYKNFIMNSGYSIDVQIEDLLGSEKFEKFDPTVITAAKSGIYNKLDNLEADIFEDVPSALFILKRKGYNLSILSNNKEESIRKQLEKHSLTNFFDLVVGRDSCETCDKKGEDGFRFISDKYNKPYWKFIENTVFITDTTVDAERSAGSGISVIARKGFASPANQDLYKARADWVVGGFKDLHQIIRLI